MSEISKIPNIKTTPKPFGVQVEWKWPDGCFWFSSLELQYLFDDGRLGKETITWPVTGKFISGLKAGERLQIRLRQTNKDGHVHDWSQGDWIEGVASADAGEYLAKIGVQVSQNHAGNIELSGAAGDVLHALFFRGALADGDLPSKSGAAELRELGFVKTQDTMAAFEGENHYNFLTPSGQEFAISYLVDSRFGKNRSDVRELVIKPSVDTSELQSTIDDVLDSIRKSDVFKIQSSGKTFINNASILGGLFTEANVDLKAFCEAVECKFNEQAVTIAHLQASIDAAVKSTIEKELQPGGVLYTAWRGR